MTRKIYPLIFFSAISLLAFWKVIFHGDFTLLTGGDTAIAYYPWFDVASHWLRRGVFLLWDPYVYAGKVNMGEPQPGLFYPLNWLIMLLPSAIGGVNPHGLQALLILDYFLAAYFFFLLARSFNLTPYGSALAGMTFALGGYTVQIYGYVNVLSGFVWMPLVLLFFRRALGAERWRRRIRWVIWGGAALGLSFLAGHHIPPIHTAFLLLLYCICILLRDWSSTPLKAKAGIFLSYGMIALTALLLTAFQWLPSAEWARYVYRWVGAGEPLKWGQTVPYSLLQEASNLSPQDGISLLLPYVSASANIYVGAIVLFLALVGILFARDRETIVFSAGAFIYFFLSVGRFSSLHGWVNTFIPGIWFAREVFYYMIPFQACVALLAGWGLDYIVGSYSGSLENTFRVFMRRAGWTMAVTVLLSGTTAALLHLLQQMEMSHPYMTAVTCLAAYVSVLGLLVFMLHTSRIKPGLFRTLVIALAALDLTSRLSLDIKPKILPAGQENTFVLNYWKKPPAAEYLKEMRQREYFRVDDPSEIFPPNYGDVWRLDATMGHGATALVDYLALRGTGWGPGSNATALLNVVYFPSRIPVPGMKKIFEDRDAVYRNPRAVPRAFVAARYRSFSTAEEMLRWIPSPLFSPRETVLVRNQDLERLPEEFRQGICNDHEGIRVRTAHLLTSAQKKASTLTDEKVQHELEVYRAPWGWSSGDEISLALEPDAAATRCFAILNYYPVSQEPSYLRFRLEGPEGLRDIPVKLPGLASDDENILLKQTVDLGILERKEYRLSFTITEASTARIDGLRFAKVPGPESAEDAGSVVIRSHKPNVLKLEAFTRRPAFVVLSEVYYPGWEAWVDGKRAPLLAVDYVLRGVPLSAGKHAIELRFRSKVFLWGLVISSIASLGIVAFLVLDGRSNRS